MPRALSGVTGARPCRRAAASSPGRPSGAVGRGADERSIDERKDRRRPALLPVQGPCARCHRPDRDRGLSYRGGRRRVPGGTGEYIKASCSDPRVTVVRNEVNLGVGGAVTRGYRIALEHGADIVVKIDSDGQMDPVPLPQIVHPIGEGLADYTKGNRFFNIEDVRGMPAVRVFGNAMLSS